MSNTLLNIDHNLPSELRFAIETICHLTGDDPIKIAHLPEEELYNMLSFLMKCEKNKIKKLFREYDTNKQFSHQELERLRKQAEKGIAKSNNNGFLSSLDKKIDESIRINFALLMRKIMINSNSGKQLATASNINTVASVAIAPKNHTNLISLENLMKMARHYVHTQNEHQGRIAANH